MLKGLPERRTLFWLAMFWMFAFCTGATLYLGMWPWAAVAGAFSAALGRTLVGRLEGLATEED